MARKKEHLPQLNREKIAEAMRCAIASAAALYALPQGPKAPDWPGGQELGRAFLGLMEEVQKLNLSFQGDTREMLARLLIKELTKIYKKVVANELTFAQSRGEIALQLGDIATDCRVPGLPVWPSEQQLSELALTRDEIMGREHAQARTGFKETNLGSALAAQTMIGKLLGIQIRQMQSRIKRTKSMAFGIPLWRSEYLDVDTLKTVLELAFGIEEKTVKKILSLL